MDFLFWRTRNTNRLNIFCFLAIFFTFWTIYSYYSSKISFLLKIKLKHRDGFQKVSENFWIYSAYHVHNQTHDNDKIIVLGICLNTRLKPYAELKLKATVCRIQNGDNFKDFFLTLGEVILIENNDRKFNAVQVVCNISQEMVQNLPNFSWVSIIPNLFSKSGQNFHNFLPIQYNPRYLSQFDKNKEEKFEFKYNLSLCIRPTYNFDNFEDFIEFIEIYRLVGVDHFTVYNHSIGPITSCLVNAPNYRNLLTIVPWTDPLDLGPKSLQTVYEKGQIMAETDCLYGYRGVSKFVGFVDLDEFILPRKKSQNLYKFLTQEFENLEEIAEFRFQNSFFIEPSPTNTSESHHEAGGGVLKNLKIINWTKRTVITPSCCDRTKFIVQPEKVLTIKVHFVEEMLGKSIIVSPKLAFLHHYRRSLSNANIKKIMKNFTDNYTRNKFGEKLYSRVQYTIKNDHKNCLKS